VSSDFPFYAWSLLGGLTLLGVAERGDALGFELGISHLINFLLRFVEQVVADPINGFDAVVKLIGLRLSLLVPGIQLFIGFFQEAYRKPCKFLYGGLESLFDFSLIFLATVGVAGRGELHVLQRVMTLRVMVPPPLHPQMPKREGSTQGWDLNQRMPATRSTVSEVVGLAGIMFSSFLLMAVAARLSMVMSTKPS
jgi:hypothetical protein